MLTYAFSSFDTFCLINARSHWKCHESASPASNFQILEDAAKLSQRMEHRGACSADNDTGDGAGVMVAIPHDFYAAQMR